MIIYYICIRYIFHLLSIKVQFYTNKLIIIIKIKASKNIITEIHTTRKKNSTVNHIFHIISRFKCISLLWSVCIKFKTN